MGRSTSATLDNRSERFVLTAFVWRQVQVLLGLLVFACLALAIAALSTWNVSDPSFSYASGGTPSNILGFPGAAFADIAMQFFGLASVIAMLPIVAWGLALVSGRTFYRIPARAGAWFGGAVLAAASLSCVPAPVTWPLPNGLGGVFGDMILRFPALFVGAYPTGTFASVIGTIIALPAAWMLIFSAGLIGNSPIDDDEDDMTPIAPSRARNVRDDDEEDESEGPLTLMAGAMAHVWYTNHARIRRVFGGKNRQAALSPTVEQPYDFNQDEFGTLNEPTRAKAPSMSERVEPSMERRSVSPPSLGYDDEPPFDADDMPLPDGILSGDDDDPAADWAPRPAPGRPTVAAGASGRVQAPAPKPRAGQRIEREAQTSFVGRDGFELPPIHLLAEPKNVARDSTLSADALEQNARMLEGVLEDFGVKGEIIHVRPGPVVTLYELEPAPGIKSSRVIGLADDIARSMSAIAARVAVVPGRNAIGIELPNHSRETVYLREMIASRDFEASKAKLAMALGKSIGGEPVITDIAKMPHLLVAGTTGSGKSVAINTFILSLLYRMTPEQCRLIMIDPKMLELSV